MRGLRRILIDIVVFVTIIATIVFLYQTYGQRTISYLFGEPRDTIFINDLSVEVTIVRTPTERRQGLSGVESLPDREGMLFVFDEEDHHGIWMKDMLFPIDVFWINENLRIVHIEENVLPESFPAIYNSPIPARFVLETNAFFADTFQVEVGDQIGITANDLPEDLRFRLTN